MNHAVTPHTKKGKIDFRFQHKSPEILGNLKILIFINIVMNKQYPIIIEINLLL